MSSLRSGTGKSSPRSISLAPMEGYVPRVVQAIALRTRGKPWEGSVLRKQVTSRTSPQMR